MKKCGFQCNRYNELPHDCKDEGYRFSNKDSRSHNGPKINKRRRKSNRSYYHDSDNYYDDGDDYDVGVYNSD